MKINKQTCASYLSVLLLASVAQFRATAREVAPPASSSENGGPTHILFTGTDIQVLHGDNLYRVQDMEGRSFIIYVGGKEVKVPLEIRPEMIKLHAVQRLAERSATVTNFKYERDYSPDNNPFRKFARDISTAQALNEGVDIAQGELDRTSETTVDINYFSPTFMKQIPNPGRVGAERNLQNAQNRISGNLGSYAEYSSQLTDELAKQMFDVIEVKFDVSAPKPIRAAYMVITAKIHEKDDPKYSRNWMYAKPIGQLDSTPQSIFVRKDGFPRGFVVDKLQVHIYENGVELPTDLSDNRATLTHDEAHEYLVIEYISAHKDATTDPQVALTKAPEDWATHPKAELFKQTYYVKVDKEGHPGDCFEDKACTTPVTDAYCDRLLKDMLFFPALNKGKPVNGTARVKLIDTSL